MESREESQNIRAILGTLHDLPDKDMKVVVDTDMKVVVDTMIRDPDRDVRKVAIEAALMGDSAKDAEEFIADGVQILPFAKSKAAVVGFVRSSDTTDGQEVATAVMDALPAGAARDVSSSYGPTSVDDRTRLIVVWTFAVVFILFAIGLLAAILLKLDSVRDIITVFLTLAGALGGFVTGRAAASSTTS